MAAPKVPDNRNAPGVGRPREQPSRSRGFEGASAPRAAPSQLRNPLGGDAFERSTASSRMPSLDGSGRARPTATILSDEQALQLSTVRDPTARQRLLERLASSGGTPAAKAQSPALSREQERLLSLISDPAHQNNLRLLMQMRNASQGLPTARTLSAPELEKLKLIADVRERELGMLKMKLSLV